MALVIDEKRPLKRVIKRSTEFLIALVALIVLALPMMMCALLVKLTSKGPVLYWSDRVGRNNLTFKMPKFRTMWIDTPPVATHLVKDPRAYLTPVGSFFRKYSLDELPQLYSVFKGDMCFIGPRPALFNQDDLIKLRTEKGIHAVTPGITGWAQVNGRDGLTIPIKVKYDEYYLQHRSFGFDVRIFVRTLLYVIRHKGVTH